MGHLDKLWVSQVAGREDREQAIRAILMALMDGPKKLGELVGATGLGRKRISRALRELKDQGLVVQEKPRGPYRLARPTKTDGDLISKTPVARIIIAKSRIKWFAKPAENVSEREKAFDYFGSLKWTMFDVLFELLAALISMPKQPAWSPETLKNRWSFERAVADLTKTLWDVLHRKEPWAIAGLVAFLNELAGTIVRYCDVFEDAEAWLDEAEALRDYLLTIIAQDDKTREKVKELIACIKEGRGEKRGF